MKTEIFPLPLDAVEAMAKEQETTHYFLLAPDRKTLLEGIEEYGLAKPTTIYWTVDKRAMFATWRKDDED